MEFVTDFVQWQATDQWCWILGLRLHTVSYL